MKNDKLRYEDNGERYKPYRKWNYTRNTGYDYDNYGLMQYIISKRIITTDNPITKFIINIYEESIKMVLHYIDELRNFKNVHWKNR
jgi:hypothetical protein